MLQAYLDDLREAILERQHLSGQFIG